MSVQLLGNQFGPLLKQPAKLAYNLENVYSCKSSRGCRGRCSCKKANWTCNEICKFFTIKIFVIQILWDTKITHRNCTLEYNLLLQFDIGRNSAVDPIFKSLYALVRITVQCLALLSSVSPQSC